MLRIFRYILLAISLINIAITSALQITGPPLEIGTNNEIPPARIEINDLARSGPAFDLYLLALRQFQNTSQSDKESYFQIAGIHGFPVVPWDGVAGSGSYPGYCMHAAVVFGPWHRPYLSLFEQTLWRHAQNIALMYPTNQREQFQTAARTLRIPYWDWAINPALPSVTTVPFLQVHAPEGVINITNPLYQYVFHPGPEGNAFPVGHPLSQLASTVRYFDFSSKQSNNAAATSVLRANAPSMLAMTYQLLSSVKDYTAMSCTLPGGNPNRATNLESIHNNIHNYVGGYYGTMTWPEFSAFDPIFWLHHANVDRLLAMWQAINPDTYVVPTMNAYGSFAEPKGSLDTGNSPLMPFHSDNGTQMHTSEGVRDISSLGYTYPELAVRNLTDQDLVTHVISLVNSKYAPRAKTPRTIDQSTKVIEDAFSRISLKHTTELGTNDVSTQWSILVQVDRNSFNTSYNIDFFMGKLPPKHQRSTAKNLVGTFGQFVMDSCSISTQSQHNGLLVGEVSLTHSLAAGLSRGYIVDLTPKSVVPVLRQHLTWAARTAKDEEIDLCHLSGLRIIVQSKEVHRRLCDSEFPLYETAVAHPEATIGKAGGA